MTSQLLGHSSLSPSPSPPLPLPSCYLGLVHFSVTYKGRGQGPTLHREINTIDQSSASPTASLVGLE